jgi:hypothetical protein
MSSGEVNTADNPPHDLNIEIEKLQKEIDIFKKKEQDYIEGIRQRNSLIMEMSNLFIGETMKLTEATAIIQKAARNAMDMVDPPKPMNVGQDFMKQIQVKPNA